MTELNKNFTAEQIADLNKIKEFFKSEMCLHIDSDFKTCYERTPHEYLEATGNPFWINIDFEKQKDLYSLISQTTFNEIWSFGKATYPDSGLELKSIGADDQFSDHDIDSLDQMSIMVEVEGAFDIDLEDVEPKNINSVNDYVKLVQEMKGVE